MSEECLICGEWREIVVRRPSIGTGDFGYCAECASLSDDKRNRKLRQTMYRKSGMGSFADGYPVLAAVGIIAFVIYAVGPIALYMFK